ncbi:hypothetical protein M3P05_05340 [Sansalvadorimonas sp. 2012CJ34-2]|uniref:Anthranilate phosphoribosyltransferase n=1 Tax=Parendozoicomonas callyspongiae TaxID=2942213 RepID=A0ABT0PDC5_9GAMM|nr:hypothetical protein [Sansalvadorimonas sp. 2012CJ34-2]MCL6269369.1 hypothetical protein [Sansalvadorimonas sp. 2012CJ34-2]
MSSNEDLFQGDQLREIVENQLTEGNPIKVKETLMRLMMTGTERSDAIDYIACALGLELENVVNNGAQFNSARYAANLDALPEMPWVDEE